MSVIVFKYQQIQTLSHCVTKVVNFLSYFYMLSSVIRSNQLSISAPTALVCGMINRYSIT